MRAPPILLAALVLVLTPSRPARAEDEKPEKVDPVDAARGYVGYKPDLVQALTADQRAEKGIQRETGMFVHEATPGAPAATAGLKPGDVVLKVNGVAIDVSKIEPKDDAAWKKWLEGDFKAVTSKIKPGDRVEMVIERAGKMLTITPVAVTRAEYEAMVERVQEDEKENESWGMLADPAAAGAPAAASLDFEGLSADAQLPADLHAVGQWQVVPEAEGLKNHVLRQKEDVPSGGRLLAIVTGAGHAYADATASCRARLVDGEQSESAGILFRMRSRHEGYAFVADGVARTLSIVALERPKNRVVASVPLPSPKKNEWHTLSVTFAGKRIEGSFDGVKVAGEDGAFASGWAGLTCEKDAQTDFDDWKAVPAGK